MPLVAGTLVWPWEQAADVLARYVEWAESAPDEVTASARLLQVPPLPDIPEPFRGRQLVVGDGPEGAVGFHESNIRRRSRATVEAAARMQWTPAVSRSRADPCADCGAQGASTHATTAFTSA